MPDLIALLQLNPTVGDLNGNADRLIQAAERAAAAGAELALASELVIPGYPPRDLLDRPSFVDAVLHTNAKVIARSGPIPLIFGSLGTHGGRLSNDAYVAQNGRLIAQARKQLLPSYDVFDEARYFAPGDALTVVDLGGKRCALSICEDAWAGSGPGRYSRDPLRDVSPSSVDLLLNLSASPFTLAKLRGRGTLFSDLAKSRGVPLAMANQVGGNDELVFDGRSSVFNAHGELLAQGKLFEEDLVLCSLHHPGPIVTTPTTQAEAAYHALVCGLRDYARKCGFSRAVLGLSGGIDSALVATLAADALGAKNVTGIAMPTRYSSQGSLDDAAKLAFNLGLSFQVTDIDPIFQAYLDNLRPALDDAHAPIPGDVTWENVQARIRGATVMAYSNRTGALPLTTGNKSEIAVGYCTLYGDMVGGLAVISDVPKTLVYEISRFINHAGERIPSASIDKPPSAELRPDQLDSDSLPPYDVLDPLLQRYVEDHRSPAQLVKEGFEAQLVERVVTLVNRAEYKRRQAAPGLIITHKAFGSGRRMPIAQRYHERT
ncbi:MAG: hypothetical protein RJA70_2821 [Pseudomonadota bacterium]